MKRQEWTLSPDLAAFVDSFSQLALSLPGRMAAVCVEIQEIESRLRMLEAQGLTRAVPDWRTSRRKGGEYLTLVFPKDADGKRARQYIGNDPGKIAEAIASIERTEEYDRLVSRLYQLMAGSIEASCDLHRVLMSLTCYRC